jgi:oxygen-independent coproporphyrinogen-3 oxidase
MTNYSLYLHIPFCRHRCSYCDFNTYAGLSSLIPDYVTALCREMKGHYSAGSKGDAFAVNQLENIHTLPANASSLLPVHTIFFGGGTPSLVPAAEYERLLETIDRCFLVDQNVELTMEANPGTLSLAYLREIHGLGFNRLSLGMQSANPQELRLLEREHQVSEVIQAVAWARQAGFDNMNLDLIFGLPYQSMESWQRTLRFALTLRPEHFSLYALTLEHGTPMQHWTSRGLLSEPDPDLAAEMYEWAGDTLQNEGYVQYEISNWALSTGDGEIKSCRHNLQYWRNQPYLGIGAGAHGYAGGVRTANVLSPSAYIQRCLGENTSTYPCTAATATATPIDRAAEMGETMMMGLRLVKEGVSDRSFRYRFGVGLDHAYREQIKRLIRLGLLEWTGEEHDRCLRLTSRGRLLGNQVFLEFI